MELSLSALKKYIKPKIQRIFLSWSRVEIVYDTINIEKPESLNFEINLFSYSILAALDRNIENFKMSILRGMVMLESWGYLEVGLSPTMWRIGAREACESHAQNQSKRVPIWSNYRFILRKINWSPINNKRLQESQSVNYLNLKFTK